MQAEELWTRFLTANRLPQSTAYLEAFHFELTERAANHLLQLVLDGVKRATASSLWSYELKTERIPQRGDYSIVTDWQGNARCVIQTTAVQILPFRDISCELCKLEGEDDALETWRDGHIAFFQAEGKEVGYVFTPDMPVVFECFEVVYQC